MVTLTEDHADDYLAALSAEEREKLGRVNGPGLIALRRFLASGEAVAFAGAGVSAPLYPLWEGLIGQLVDAGASRLTREEADTCRVLAKNSPEDVVEIVRRQLGTAGYREVLREVLRVRTDPESGRSWTPVQELVCRCAFKAVITTNYDPGIVDARMRIRPAASATGFMTWEDELGLDRWRTGDVFGEAELPVLFAHGQHNRPDSVVLSTTEYRRAYTGKLPEVLGRLVDAGHLAWIGFSFADQRIAAILGQIAERSGTRVDPGAAPRHVAIMPWDPAAEGNDPRILAERTQIGYGAQLVLYPARGHDHSALRQLLLTLVDPRFPAAGDLPARPRQRVIAPGSDVSAGVPGMPVTWAHGPQAVSHFIGRGEELAKLDRWAADPQVALVGATAWGGAGKTTLVTHWVQEANGVSRRPGLRGVFGWNFYADPSAEHWAAALLRWAEQEFGFQITQKRLAARVLALLPEVPLLLVLDGLEVAQESQAAGEFGRLLDGTLREVLSGVCRLQHGGLIFLTSRFPFADLETFDGDRARMMEVPPFTPAEGSALLNDVGGSWLSEAERRALVLAVDGHALAVGVLAGLLADHPLAGDIAALQADLAAATRLSLRVSRVLQFYADRLSNQDKYLLAAVSLFTRPVSAASVLAVAGHGAFAGRLADWTLRDVETAARERLAGLVSWHQNGTISVHPLVRDTFRRLVLGAAEAAAEIALAGATAGEIVSQSDALRVVEAMELLLEAGEWHSADGIYIRRAVSGRAFQNLPAARLGQRAATAFVATPARRDACATRLAPHDLGFYLNEVGLFALQAGDLGIAQEYLALAVRHSRDENDMKALSIALRNLARCHGNLGEAGQARDAAAEALTWARRTGDRTQILHSHAFLGWLAGLTGDTAGAEAQFAAADQIEVAGALDNAHLYSLPGTWWAEWLARTGRYDASWMLTMRNREICKSYGWNQDTARCDLQLGRLALSAGNTAAGEEYLAAAAECFRDGDFLNDLAATLTHQADLARVTGDLDAAEHHATEAITITAPRKLVPARSAALVARALIRASAATSAAGLERFAQGRDAAGAALRLATHHHLAWHELDALRAQAALDQAEGTDRGWAAQADAVHDRLIPPGLDSDPLAVIERRVAVHVRQPLS
jgi:tetratricopeptide (TPR) repeat protein